MLRSAERLRERAISRGERANTRSSSDNALLRFVTAADHLRRLGLVRRPTGRACFAPVVDISSAGSALEELDRSFVLLGRRTRAEGAEVLAFAGLRVLLTRVEPILPRFQLPDHASLDQQGVRRLACRVADGLIWQSRVRFCISREAAAVRIAAGRV